VLQLPRQLLARLDKPRIPDPGELQRPGTQWGKAYPLHMVMGTLLGTRCLFRTRACFI
jgi:hypothetical protein